MKAIFEKFFDESIRIERVIFLAGALGDGALSDDLHDFFDEEVETIERALGRVPDWIDLDGSSRRIADGVFEWLTDAGKLGFLVQFATPVMEKTGEKSRTYSWGYYSTYWVYGDSFDEAIALGVAWVGERRLAEDKKFAALQKKGGV